MFYVPFHDVEDTDGKITEGKNKEYHHQHASCLTSGFNLFDLSCHGTCSDFN